MTILNIKIIFLTTLFVTLTFNANAEFSDHFVTTWKTDNSGGSNDTSITIPTNASYTYSYNVDWDNDGTFDEFGILGDITHDFGTAGIKTIRISGEFPSILFAYSTDKNKILSINQWGNNPWANLSKSFYGAKNLIVNALDTPNLQNCQYLNQMFSGALLVGKDSDAANWNWDTTTISDMSEMFSNAYSFNQDISNWNTGSVTNLSKMFSGAAKFNQYIGNWNTSNVGNMNEMFLGASAFNQSIENWNTTNVANMSYMFKGATLFNQNIGNWDINNVFSIDGMFMNATSFNQDIGSWNGNRLTSYSNMFYNAISFDQDLSEWNVENIYDLQGMFENVRLSVKNYEALLIGWNTQNFNSIAQRRFNAGNSVYCSQNAQIAHNNLTSNFRWIIEDGGVCENSLTIISQNFAIVDENKIDVLQVEATYPGLNIFSFNLTGGKDMSQFSIDSLTGKITFNNPPNFEIPSDFNNDNEYEVEVEVTVTNNVTPIDSVKQTIAIYVNNINEELMSEHFVTTWNVDDKVLTIQAFSYKYFYNVDWNNDGIFDEFNISGPVSHNYATAGVKTIRISGDFPMLILGSNDLRGKIISVNQWGSNPWKSMNSSFNGASNLIITAQDTPNLFKCQDMSRMFSNARLVGANSEAANWNWKTPTITNMGELFYNAQKFNQDIGSWDTANVTNMTRMFYQASSFNQNINRWDTSNITDMSFMFFHAFAYNQDMKNWNTNNVYSMKHMFNRALTFNQDISNWNTSNVNDMQYMFSEAFSFNQNIGSWDTKYVAYMNSMFNEASSFNQDIGNWNTLNVQKMNDMFKNANYFNQYIGNWNTSKVRDFSSMFNNAISFNHNLSNWNIERGSNFHSIFKNVKLSSKNYDALLINWSSQILQQNMSFDAGNSSYCSGAAQVAHDKLTTLNNWIILDNGICENSLRIITKYLIFDENQTQIFHIMTSDPDNDLVTFAISGGEDELLFSIDSYTGEIEFNNPPDFENPLDANNDNIYTIKVTVTDNGTPIETDTQVINIYINNINENLLSEHFVSTWNADDGKITISTDYEDIYYYNVDWNNDGIFDDLNLSGNITHDYGIAGVNTIRISGHFPKVVLSSITRNKIISIDQWGRNPWTSMNSAFNRASNLTIKAQDSPNLLLCADLSNMFSYANMVGGLSDTANWNWRTPSITNMSNMFSYAYNFNQDIQSWQTGSVENMNGIFNGAHTFNHSLETWDTSRVTNMSNMFFNAYDFNQDLNNWDTSNVNNMSGMFDGSFLFNQDISSWNTSSVTNMSNMFSDAYSFNRSIGNWNTSEVIDASGMFNNAISFNQNISNWNVEKVENFNLIFNNVRLAIENYDALLIGWNSQNLQQNQIFYVNKSFYCSNAAKVAHDYMTSVRNWNIIDKGLCQPELAIVSDNNVSINENHTTVIKVLTTDPDGDTPTFIISGGNDQTLFTINPYTGVLSFINPPNYEVPNSFNNNNIYQVEITAMDDGIPQEFASQLIIIYVNNLLETSPVDLSLQITSNTNYADPGDEIEFTIKISNIGLEPSVNTIIFDFLPIEIIHSSWKCKSTGTARCSKSGIGEFTNYNDIPNDLSEITYTVNVTMSNIEFQNFYYRAFSETSEPQYDTDLSNNFDNVFIIRDTIFKDGVEN